MPGAEPARAQAAPVAEAPGWVRAVSSLAAVAGGVPVGRVPEGPHLERGEPVRFGGVLGAFRLPGWRVAVPAPSVAAS